MILAWWCLPIPSFVVKPLFWNTSAPQRLAFAMGLLSHLAAFVLLLRVGAVASLARVAVALALVVIAAALSKFVLFDANLKGFKYDLLILPLLLAAYLIGRKHRSVGQRAASLRRTLERAGLHPVQSGAARRTDLCEARHADPARAMRRSRRRIRKNGWWRMPAPARRWWA